LPAETPALTREEVIAGYRLILGRPPESDAVIEQHRQTHATLEGLGRALSQSAEFAARGFPGLPPPRDVGPLDIETEADPEGMARLLAHLAEYWEGVGETAPHWSVVTDERFAPERIAESRADFYASGEHDLRLIEATLARIGRALPEFRHGVEYGCGVGRLAVHLAPRLPRYTGCDISVPHLRLAIQALAEVGLRRTEMRRVTPADLMPVNGFDFWFSCIVLQHNPPPLIMAALDGAFARLLPGGVAMFQVPVWVEGYRFRVDEYLAGTPGTEMEQHVVPQDAVLALADRHGCVLRDLREDNELLERPGRALSNFMTFQKRGPARA
jgi:SAM-dependent methyltransferase